MRLRSIKNKLRYVNKMNLDIFFFYDIQPLNPSAEASRQLCIQQILYLYVVP